MSDTDPSPPDAKPFKNRVEQVYQAEPRVIYEVRDSGAVAAAWWVGGLVAVVAILSVTFLVTRNPNGDQQVAKAVEQGRLQGALESSQSTLADTQAAANQAAQNAAASATLAKGAVTTASDADRTANQAAESANGALSDASARAADTAPPPAVTVGGTP